MTPLAPFGISLGIFDSDNRAEIYEFLNRNGWVDDISRLPDVGAFVAKVVEGSSAQVVGFQEGDIILKVNGQLGMAALEQIAMTPFKELSEAEVLRQDQTEIIAIKGKL